MKRVLSIALLLTGVMSTVEGGMPDWIVPVATGLTIGGATSGLLVYTVCQRRAQQQETTIAEKDGAIRELNVALGNSLKEMGKTNSSEVAAFNEKMQVLGEAVQTTEGLYLLREKMKAERGVPMPRVADVFNRNKGLFFGAANQELAFRGLKQREVTQ